ncbi:lysosomal acid glucosylceramidase-like [Ptiloglossa arizonensis]|uniref:lysosomal acid glucosylceramidase-like n=1 Tax=Ptiloglossa arizonensis TaxID=3350558 RepID=UPI003F9F42C2
MLPKNVPKMWKALSIIVFFLAKVNANDCASRNFGVDRIVCVCNATYCDGLSKDQPEVPEDGSAYWYVSNKQGRRLKLTTVQFGTCRNLPFEPTLTVDSTKKYQKILGFGGALTDSAGLNIKLLSPAAQDQLIRAYYDPKTGSKYTLCRIPIGGCDFSTRAYTYDTFDDDATLEHFALTQEDYDLKIPLAKEALKLNPEMKFFGAVWSPPPWMKTNDKINGKGYLKEKYYQVYAEYILKFLDEYKNNGLDLWAVSTGNEPLNGAIPFDPLNSIGWHPRTVAKWIANNLGPTLNASKHNETLILALDDQRNYLPWYIERMAMNKETMKYVSGIATHLYFDFIVPATVLDQTHDKFPDKFLLMSEGSAGTGALGFQVLLGSWHRGEKYMLSIIEYMNHWSVGWVDWNIALNEQGGPNWVNNFVDSPIIVNPDKDEFYKQPMYYAIKHFSRFVDRGSVKIAVNETVGVKSTAFLTPSNEVVVVLYNRDVSSKNVILKDPQRGTLCLKLSPHSMNTVKYKQ